MPILAFCVTTLCWETISFLVSRCADFVCVVAIPNYFFSTYALRLKKPGFLPNLRLKLRCLTIIMNRQDACSTKSEFSCGVGILPARLRLIENGARCELQRVFWQKTRLLIPDA